MRIGRDWADVYQAAQQKPRLPKCRYPVLKRSVVEGDLILRSLRSERLCQRSRRKVVIHLSPRDDRVGVVQRQEQTTIGLEGVG